MKTAEAGRPTPASYHLHARMTEVCSVGIDGHRLEKGPMISWEFLQFAIRIKRDVIPSPSWLVADYKTQLSNGKPGSTPDDGVLPVGHVKRMHRLFPCSHITRPSFQQAD
jgi:hypothetical protein